MKLIIVIFLLGGLLALPFGAAKYNMFYNKQIGIEYAKSLKNKEREVFKNSKPYTENMAQTLSSYKMQYDLAGPENKKIIANNIKIEFANMNPELIENPNLRYFFYDIMGGNL
ncbi:hypothetical protein [Cetobacterium sp.]|uniref:hypothetical protein n=1 Tax=Cetobacterium sp. TaxID=2071632 RepID=UPI003F2F9E96